LLSLKILSYVLAPLFLAVPEGGGPHPVVDEGEEGLLDQQLGVEDDQLGRGGDEVVALVELEKLDEDLRLVIFLKRKKKKKIKSEPCVWRARLASVKYVTQTLVNLRSM
jgi:hypothetical protein